MFDTRTLNHVVTNDAEFRTFVNTIRAALDAVGMVQATDAGQIDPTTVLRPAASGTAGVEYWHFPGQPEQLRGANGEPYLGVTYGMGVSTNQPRASMQLVWSPVASAAPSAGSYINGGTLIPNSVTSAMMHTQADETGIRMIFSSLMSSGNNSGGGFFAEKLRDVNGLLSEDPIAIMASIYATTSPAGGGQVHLLDPSGGAFTARTFAEAGVANLGVSAGSTNGATDLALEPMALPFKGKWFFGSPMFGAWGDLNGAGVFDFPWLGYQEYKAIPVIPLFGAGGSTICIPWE
jgi:hypothetical protein